MGNENFSNTQQYPGINYQNSNYMFDSRNIKNITTHNEVKTDNMMIDIDAISRQSKCVCLLTIIRNVDGKLMQCKGTGFFTILNIGNTKFHCLISNEHVITEESIHNHDTINIIFQDNTYEYSFSIKLNKRERIIKYFKYLDNPVVTLKNFNKGRDVTVVEILPDDGLKEDNFLQVETSTNYQKFVDQDVYMIQYPEGEKKVKCSSGKIVKVKGYSFFHTSDSRNGSSGSPIISFKTGKVLGVHRGGLDLLMNNGHREGLNFGTFIAEIVREISEEELSDMDNSFINPKNASTRPRSSGTALREYRQNEAPNLDNLLAFITYMLANQRQFENMGQIAVAVNKTPNLDPELKNSIMKQAERNSLLRNSLKPNVGGNSLVPGQNYNYNNSIRRPMGYPNNSNENSINSIRNGNSIYSNNYTDMSSSNSSKRSSVTSNYNYYNHHFNNTNYNHPITPNRQAMRYV